jgi:(E)-4-hydroxy-3-methylbut-2-enyl-diphosphate synthase
MDHWVEGEVDCQEPDSVDPYHYKRRHTNAFTLGKHLKVGSEEPPTVFTYSAIPLYEIDQLESSIKKEAPLLADTPIEGLCFKIVSVDDLAKLETVLDSIGDQIPLLVIEVSSEIDLESLSRSLPHSGMPLALVRDFEDDAFNEYKRFMQICYDFGAIPIAGLSPHSVDGIFSEPADNLIVTLRSNLVAEKPSHRVGLYRQLAERLKHRRNASPVWIRNQSQPKSTPPSFLDRLLDASILTGSLLCDGIGDIVSIESETDFVRSTKLAYNVLQGAGARISKTEFVACPSCGRTLFDLQSTTQRIREKTGHLKGVKIAIMGCIVNGPGEMADADFGYVGGAPAKINLYVGKQCVQYNIPQSEADDRLIELIKKHDKWVDPEPVAS